MIVKGREKSLPFIFFYYDAWRAYGVTVTMSSWESGYNLIIERHNEDIQYILSIFTVSSSGIKMYMYSNESGKQNIIWEIQ